jgi:hypothetical protein
LAGASPLKVIQGLGEADRLDRLGHDVGVAATERPASVRRRGPLPRITSAPSSRAARRASPRSAGVSSWAGVPVPSADSIWLRRALP